VKRAAAALAFAAAVAVACPSRAQEVIAVDAALAESTNNWGFNGDLRVGYRTGLSRILYGWIFQFELVGGYRHIFSSIGDLNMGRVGGGLRTGFSIYGLQVLPFVHVSAADASGYWGELVDLGAALDWRFNWVSIGSHYDHGFLHLDSGWQHFDEVGAHVEFRGYWLE
jgi:hypothetical protein